MNKIILKHSSIVINNYQLGDCPRLENFFTIYDRTYHSNFLKGVEYIEDENKLIIPRGLDVYYIENLLQDKAMLDIRHDPYDKTEPIMIKYMPRNDIQKEALCFMLGEKVQYKDNKAKSQLSVNLNTGVGKTYCSIATIAYSGIRSAIITSSIGWLEQWKNCILEYTDTKPNEIFMLSGSPSIYSLLRKDISKYKFILISHNTIKAYGDKLGWDKVSELFKYMRIGMKFYDEAHLNFDNMCKIDYYTNTFKTYYVTATPARSDRDENNIFQLYFRNIPSIDLFDEDSDPHTKYIAMKYSSKPSAQNISDCKNQYGLDRNKYTGYVMGQENLYRVARSILQLGMKSEGKMLIFIGTNASIDRFKEWMILEYPELNNSIGVYTSATPKDIKHLELEKKFILSTTKSCGAAVDIKGLKFTVVLAEPFKSEVLARQTLGRTRDDNTFYIEVVDTGFRKISEYYKEKKKIFDKYATSCTEIVLSQEELENRERKIIDSRTLTPTTILYRSNDEFNPNELYHQVKPYKKIFINVDDKGCMR